MSEVRKYKYKKGLFQWDLLFATSAVLGYVFLGYNGFSVAVTTLNVCMIATLNLSKRLKSGDLNSIPTSTWFKMFVPKIGLAFIGLLVMIASPILLVVKCFSRPRDNEPSNPFKRTYKACRDMLVEIYKDAIWAIEVSTAANDPKVYTWRILQNKCGYCGFEINQNDHGFDATMHNHGLIQINGLTHYCPWNKVELSD